MSEKTLIESVRDQYANTAGSELSNDLDAVRAVAAAFGYSDDDLASLPSEANMGLSCGNPLALSGIKPGDIVVDLGCGGGMDVFLAAKKVGETGRVIGIDMTPEMLQRAQAGAEKLGLNHVEFHLASIDQLPLPDNSVDLVISNCVINLAPDKRAVFTEMLRVLKPGGRVAVSDIALKQTLPEAVKQNVEAYVGCIAGAIMIEEYRAWMQEAGFVSVVVTDTGADLNAYAKLGGASCCAGVESCCETASIHDGLLSVMQTINVSAYAASVRVHALKSTSASHGVSQPVSAQTSSAPRLPLSLPTKKPCCSGDSCG
jgi:arsenite methyltransferase